MASVGDLQPRDPTCAIETDLDKAQFKTVRASFEAAGRYYLEVISEGHDLENLPYGI